MAKTLKDLPLGAKIKHPGMKYNDKPITFIKVTHDGHYTPGETIFITEDLISKKAFDAEEPKNSNSDRKSYGNNNYELSNIDQWLNSTSKNWYSARHGADQAPTSSYVTSNPYADEAGFLFNFTDEVIENIRETTIRSAKHSADGGGITNLKRKIFLMSRTEAGLGDEFSGRAEGKPFPYFTSDEKRKASSYYWLRTPYADGAYRVRDVNSDGSLNRNNARIGNDGVRPALSFPSSVLVTNQDTNGAWEIAFNRPPEITGENKDLGNITDGFEYTYSVIDPDNDEMTVIERLNNSVMEGGVKNNVKNGNEFTIKITREMLYKMELGKRNHILIEVTDGKGGAAQRSIYFTRTNSAPVIEIDTDKDLGEITNIPKIQYKITDPEGDDAGVEIFIDNLLINKIDKIEQNKFYEVKIEKGVWANIDLGKHIIKIVATDSQGGISEEKIAFTRAENQIDIRLSKPYATKDMLETKLKTVMPILKATNPGTFDVKVLACNNAFDEAPSWEDITEQAINLDRYEFINDNKTAESWGFNMRIIVKEKGVK